MNLESLLRKLEAEGKIKKQKSDSLYLNGLLDAAHRNFKAAEANIENFEEVSFKTSYEGLLQISRTILLLNGYRPDDGEQHKTTFLVAGAILGEKFSELIDKIDMYRIKRNNAIYNPLGLITKTEAQNIIKTSKEYWFVVSKYLAKKDNQLRLFEF